MIPVSYEVARAMLDDAETFDEVTNAIRASAEGFVREFIVAEEDDEDGA